MKRFYLIFLVLIFSALFITGCKHTPDDEENLDNVEKDEMEISFDGFDFWGESSGSYNAETKTLKLSKVLLKENGKDYEYHGAFFSLKDVEIKGKYIRVDYEQTSGRLSTTVKYSDDSELITPCDKVKKSIFILFDSNKKMSTFHFTSTSKTEDVQVKINKISFANEVELEKNPIVDSVSTGKIDNNISALNFVKNMEFGFNLANYFDTRDAYNEDLDVCLNWGEPVTTKALVKKIGEAGGKTIRIPVTWCNHIVDDKYTIDPFWMAKVKEVVDWAYKEGYYVILNEHHSVHGKMNSPIIYHEGYILRNTPDDIAESERFLKAIWTQITAAFNNSYDEHLIFETMNEPRNTSHGEHEFYPAVQFYGIDSRDCEECIADHKLNNRYNQLILDTIRASGGNNAKRFVMVPSMGGNYLAAYVDNFKMPTDTATDKLILTFHHYPLYDTLWFVNEAEHKQIIDEIYAEANEKFVKKGIPVVVGEIGPTGADYFKEHGIEVPEADAQATCNYVAQVAGGYGMAVIMWTREYSFENVPFAKKVQQVWKKASMSNIDLSTFELWDNDINSFNRTTCELEINRKYSGGQFNLSDYNGVGNTLTFAYENLSGEIMVKAVYKNPDDATKNIEDVKYLTDASGSVSFTIDSSKELKAFFIQSNSDSEVELTLKFLKFATKD
ncbi:MAG: glycoside hydrolase family 5 protein [Treponema sp.]|nr:glycoside hydrolase family 5 protein [Treponema sp.]